MMLHYSQWLYFNSYCIDSKCCTGCANCTSRWHHHPAHLCNTNRKRCLKWITLWRMDNQSWCYCRKRSNNTLTLLTPANTFNYTVTETATGCTSGASANVVINAVPSATTPIVGTITQPTCTTSTGSVALSGLPSGAWTINPGAIAGSGTTTTLTLLTPATPLTIL